MNHKPTSRKFINDEMLILHYYDDGLSATEKRAIDAELSRDGELAARYRELTQALGNLPTDEAVALPEDLRQRLHATVDRAADREPGRQRAARPRSHWTFFLLGAGAATAIAAAIAFGVRQSPGHDPALDDLTAAVATDAIGAPDPFARAMRVYFRDSRLELEGLPDTGNGDRSAMIVDLIAQNRAFARLAIRNESPELARVLRAFEPILVRLAADDITAEESAALRDKLAFELNVMLTKLTRDASEYAASTEQETST